MDYNRIKMIRDHRSGMGKLIVQRGAIGTIRSRIAGRVGVVFDDGQDVYIEPDGGGRLSQEVAFVDTAPLSEH